jgi:hypothetical protein
MPAAAIAGIATVGSAVVQGNSARSAARAQAQSADAATAEQRRQFDLTRADQQPWLQAGQNALSRLQDPSAFQADPGYAFTRSEGMRGIERSAAARGGATGGNALRALTQFNAGLADQAYGNWWNRQAGLAGAGQASAQSIGAFGQQTANNIGNNLMAAGDARASGIAGQANALTGALSGLSNLYGYTRGAGGGPTMANNYRGPMYGSYG